MYTPKIYNPPSQEEMETFITSNSFGILVTPGLQATHIPLDFEKNEPDPATLFGHLSNANNQTLNLDGSEALAIFTGPHAYISSSWYEEINVPTWNYIAVHVYGTIRLLTEKETKDAMKKQLAKYENNNKCPVTMDQMPEDFLRSHLKGICAFRMKITKIEGSYKMSQNRNNKDYQNIISELQKSDDQNMTDVAEMMKKLRNE